MLKKLKKGMSGLFYWCIGHLLLLFNYDRMYTRGRWFQGKLFGMCAQGWKWVVNDYFSCKRMRIHSKAKWPISPRIHIVCPENISFHPDDLNNFQGFGNYYQALGKIEIGRGTYIAPNVGIITSNHDIYNLDYHSKTKAVIIGEKCWIGMNSIILPGVVLGNRTIVGAGSVVTKSYAEGNCIIAGNPAQFIKTLDH